MPRASHAEPLHPATRYRRGGPGVGVDPVALRVRIQAIASQHDARLPVELLVNVAGFHLARVAFERDDEAPPNKEVDAFLKAIVGLLRSFDSLHAHDAANLIARQGIDAWLARFYAGEGRPDHSKDGQTILSGLYGQLSRVYWAAGDIKSAASAKRKASNNVKLNSARGTRSSVIDSASEILVKRLILVWEEATGQLVTTTGDGPGRSEPRQGGAAFVVDMSRELAGRRIASAVVRQMKRLRDDAVRNREELLASYQQDSKTACAQN